MLGAAAGYVVEGVVESAARAVIQVDPIEGPALETWPWAWAAGGLHGALAFGIVVGVIQWSMLRTVLPSSERVNWMVASAAGWTAEVVIPAGVLVGLVQARVMERYRPGVGFWWLVLSFFGRFAGLAVGVNLLRRTDILTPLDWPVLGLVLAAVMGAGYGAVTGLLFVPPGEPIAEPPARPHVSSRSTISVSPTTSTYRSSIQQ